MDTVVATVTVIFMVTIISDVFVVALVTRTFQRRVVLRVFGLLCGSVTHCHLVRVFNVTFDIVMLLGVTAGIG
jgi:hypothetical protein